MRPTALVGLAAVLFAPPAAAQQPYRAVVVADEVKVRAAPSDRFEETGTLRKGQAVIVEKEEANGWLAIAAPYGSVSWIATQFVEDPAPDKPTPKYVVVSTEDDPEVTLATGKAGLPQPLDIRRMKVTSGTPLLMLGPKVKFDGKVWYPVAPPAEDVRYVPKTAVQFERAAPNNFTVHVSDSPARIPPASIPPAGAPPATNPPAIAPTLGEPVVVTAGAAAGSGPIATVPGPGSSPPPAGGVVAGKPAVNHPLWAQAETAERENRLADAEKAYFDLAALMNGPGGDHDIANLCYTRIHALRERKRAGTTTGQPPRDDRGARPGAPQAVTPPSGSSAVSATAGTKTDAPASAEPEWIGPGTLVVSGLTLDGINRKTYRLEAPQGMLKVYVLAGPGVDLSLYVGKRVSVFGTAKTVSGVSKPIVLATNVDAQ